MPQQTIDETSAHASDQPPTPQSYPDKPQSITVEIYDQSYHLRGTDPAYIAHLAGLVDGKMRAVSALGGTVDSLRVAVLASLNIADELECLRQQYAALAGSVTQTQTTMRTRSASLAGMLDELLEEPPIRRAG